MRMRDRDGAKTAGVRNRLHGFGVDQRNAVPKNIAAGSAHQERSLAYAEPRVGYDAQQPGLFFTETIAMG